MVLESLTKKSIKDIEVTRTKLLENKKCVNDENKNFSIDIYEDKLMRVYEKHFMRDIILLENLLNEKGKNYIVTKYNLEDAMKAYFNADTYEEAIAKKMIIYIRKIKKLEIVVKNK